MMMRRFSNNTAGNEARQALAFVLAVALFCFGGALLLSRFV
jgi:hypothetical protein